MTTGGVPDPPRPTSPPENWEHLGLYKRVREALYILPSLFESELNITGVLATDLFTFNSSLGATIENQVVEVLNDLLQAPRGVGSGGNPRRCTGVGGSH